MLARSDNAMRRSLVQPADAASVFTQGFLNASLIQLAICAPPRRAATRSYSEIYITELGAKARKAAETAADTVSA